MRLVASYVVGRIHLDAGVVPVDDPLKHKVNRPRFRNGERY